MGNEKLNNGVIDLEGEVWKVINHPSIGEYPNYEISNFGRVKSRRGDREKLLKTNVAKGGYLRVGLRRRRIGEKPKKFRVHRLVALMFIPNPDNLPQINHLDENKTNNCVSNLCWCSAKENINYGTAIARSVASRKTSEAFKEGIERRKETIKTSTTWKEAVVKSNTKKRKQVFQYDLNFKLLNVFESLTKAAKLTGCAISTISRCCNGKQKTAYNYIWSYEPLSNTSNQLTLFTETKVS